MKKPEDIKVLGIIPARGGSTRIPRKNIKVVGGKPLICHSIETAKKAKSIDAFIVSTDDEEIAEIARKAGADVPFLRPKHTARKYSAEIEYQQHALKWLKKNRGWEPDLVVMIKPTSPLRTPEVIDEVVKMAKKNPQFTMVTTVSPPPFHPYRMSRRAKDGCLELIVPDMVKKEDYKVWGGYVPTQKLPEIYAHNTIVDLIRADCIEAGTEAVFKGPIGGVVTDPKLSADIDTEDDLEFVDLMLKAQKKKK
tara:strand:- start:17473 stop:18225 length:753 start_codon:yes stop_codon:yes gene_type:complete